MKRILLFITPLIFSLTIFGQVHVNFAPRNPDFDNYIRTKENLKKLKSSTDKSFGYIPIPLQINFAKHSTSNINKKSTLPKRYSLLDYSMVTSVKDQGGGGNGGNCWTFTTMGAIESNWLKKGLGVYDLSEQNIAACHGYEWGYGEGGNELIALAYLTRLSGPILESQNQYNTNDSAIYCTEGVTPISYVTEAIWLPNDAELIKQTLIDFGAISISMTWESTAYNSTDYTYYYGGLATVNHAVLLTGWDDDKVTAGGIGAWICKNQWNSTWADNGYFYISYNDTRALTSAAYYPTKLTTNKIDTLFMYDTLGPNSAMGISSNTAYGLTKFSTKEKTFINKVGTFISTENSVVDIEIYNDFDGNSLTNKLGSLENKIIRFPGYYTFDISSVIDSGDFYVKIKYTTPGYNYPVPIEKEDDFEGEPFARPSIENGISWISLTGNYWTAVGSDQKNYNFDLCIRAYGMTNNPVSFFTVNREYVCQNGGSATFSNTSFGNLDSIVWDFGNGASPSSLTDTLFTDSTIITHSVTYSTSGEKDISLIAFGNLTSDTLTKNSLIIVGDSINVVIPISELETVTGKDYSLKAYGADNYTWYLKNSIISTQNSLTKSESFEGIIIYDVYGTQGTCSGRDTSTVYIWKNPDNDDVCDAIMLNYGESVSYSNKHATIQDNEPSPPEEGCVAPNSWCVEGGLQHSVWFKFKAAETQTAYIEAYGFDCQIAVYKAKTCDSILQNKYTLLAANDDIGLLTKDSRIEDIINLEKDSIYWLLVDGSAGGDTGTFKVFLSKWPNGIENNEIPENNINVFPNPNNGSFNIQFNSMESQNILMKIYNINGQKIYSEKYNNVQGEFNKSVNIPDISKGIYFIKIIGDSFIGNCKTLIQ